jgi:hypothetical protein
MGSMRVMKPGLRRKTCMLRGAGIAVLIGEAACEQLRQKAAAGSDRAQHSTRV